jgi:AraC-like DNA-binding protein
MPMPSSRLPSIPPLDPQRYAPSALRPVRAKARRLCASTQVEPHRHDWAQVAFSATGVTRVTAGRSTYMVPPSRAVWIPPQIEHAISVVRDADMRMVYVHQPAGACGPEVDPDQQDAWRHCRVIEVSPLLRELVRELSEIDPLADLDAADRRREHGLSLLLLDELRRAPPLPLGVALPQDKRLRHLCEAVLEEPTRHDTLDAWADGVGASARTITRLFRDELGTTFVQWRQQVLLAKALALAADRLPMNQIAAELGYASPSAFSAMVTRTVGMAPSRFLGTAA